MRRLLPLWSSVFAVLLLSQWAGAGAACLPLLAGHAAPLCLVAADHHPAPGSQDHAGSTGCPLCAPLPPGILPGPAVVAPAPAIHRTAFAAARPAWTAPTAALPSPLQARAPPTET